MKLFLHRGLLTASLFCFISIGLGAQSIRIMPLGNSITYDHNSFDESNPRPAGDRISYRFLLYQLLKAEGLDFDFVGSEDAGNNFFQDASFDDNAGFPGIQSNQLATLIVTGYNGYTKQYVSSGPYLNYYPTDIILLHIGTNNLVTDANDVEDILDNIRLYDPDVIILVARIINRRSYHSATTTFNNNVELMVNSRNDDRIRMVNLENGAGINYSTDMIDNLHPNQTGYNKMGQKWFEAILALNQAPSISYIPDQSTDKGEPFNDISLDQYVEDTEDPDFLLAWDYEQEQGSKLTVSLDANRVLHVTPDPTFSGTESLKLKVRDTGNGAFPAADSVIVVYRVNHMNTAPVITSVPQTSISQGQLYSYSIVAYDADGDPLQYRTSKKPSWLSLSGISQTLSGTPQDADVGLNEVELVVSDGADSVIQAFTIEVFDVNDPPSVVSPTVLTAPEDENFTHAIVAEDLDGDEVSIELLDVPDWLDYTATGEILFGQPGNEDVGIYSFTVKVSDGQVDNYETHQLTVVNVNDPPEIATSPDESTIVGHTYMYRFFATDIDTGDDLVYSALQLPTWLSFTTSSTDALVYGVPTGNDAGANLVMLQVSDGIADVLHAYTLNVTFPTGGQDIKQQIEHTVYPNPASNLIRVELGSPSKANFRVTSISGTVLLETSFSQSDFLELEITNLPAGVYFYHMVDGDLKSSGKFIKQ